MAINFIRTIVTAVGHHQDKTSLPTQLVFDAKILSHEQSIPQQFIWPDDEKPSQSTALELPVPLIDPGGFLSSDPVAASTASRLVGEACEKHRFFLVVSHGVDQRLIADAHRYVDKFFRMSLTEKQRAQRKLGETCYDGAELELEEGEIACGLLEEGLDAVHLPGAGF